MVQFNQNHTGSFQKVENMSKKVILVIMDGWGLGLVPTADAIQQAKTPFVSSLRQTYPHSTLVTCGEAVGLPDGQIGNSEVGHMNLGAGRVVYQDLVKLNLAVEDKSLYQNEALSAAFAYAEANNKPIRSFLLILQLSAAIVKSQPSGINPSKNGKLASKYCT